VIPGTWVSNPAALGPAASELGEEEVTWIERGSDGWNPPRLGRFILKTLFSFAS